MTQSSLFDPEEGERRKQDGMARAEDHAVVDWNAEVDRAVLRVCYRQALFTTDDVWAELVATTEAATHEPRAMGPAMRRAEIAGWCKPTSDFWLSRRPERHRAPMRVWASLRHEGVA